MATRHPKGWLGVPAAVITVSATLITIGGLAAVAQSRGQYNVSQKGREFRPGELSINRGDTVQIVNDDGDLRHHAYVETDKFNFDSGDQEPGSKASITFPVSGDFDVLCASHPKMKLTVHVK
jgi:plastocyanin